jgi:hypothetical protein
MQIAAVFYICTPSVFRLFLTKILNHFIQFFMNQNDSVLADLPLGWKWVKLGEIGKVLSGFAFKSSDFVEKGTPVIKIGNIGYSEFHWKDQQFVSDLHLKKLRIIEFLKVIYLSL